MKKGAFVACMKLWLISVLILCIINNASSFLSVSSSVYSRNLAPVRNRARHGSALLMIAKFKRTGAKKSKEPPKIVAEEPIEDLVEENEQDFENEELGPVEYSESDIPAEDPKVNIKKNE